MNLLGRTWQVNVQADADFRYKIETLSRLKCRNRQGNMVPLGSLATVKPITGPLILNRYNMYPAATIQGATSAELSSRQGIDLMVEMAKEELPQVDGVRMDRHVVPRTAGRQHGHGHLRLRRAHGLSGAGGPVRKLVAAAGRHSRGAALSAVRHRRRAPGGHGHQHLHAGRLRRAGGPVEQERHSHRGVRQAAARIGHLAAGRRP